MAFNGKWLEVKVGNTFVEFPRDCIAGTTYKSTPNQRMEWSAERDTTGLLHLETVENMPPKIEFETPPIINTQVGQISALLKSAYIISKERKLRIRYYDQEDDDYKEWDCYMPDMTFPIHNIDLETNTITYDPIRYAFIGY